VTSFTRRASGSRSTRPRPAAPEQGFAANAAAALALQAVGVLATGSLTLVLVRLLGPTEYGIYALALSVGAVVLLPVDAGITTATARFLSETVRRRDAAQIVRSGVALKMTIGVAASVLLAAAAPSIASAYGEARLTWPIRLVAGVVLTQSLLGFVVGCFSAVRMTMSGLAVVTVESLGETVIVAVAAAAGAGAAGAIAGRFAAYGFAAILGIGLLDRRFRLRRPRARARREVVVSILRYGFALALVDAAWALFVQIDVILIAAILDSAAAGQFQAPVRLLALVAYPGLAVAVALGPRVHVDDGTSLLRRFRHSLRLLLAFHILAAVATATIAPPLVQAIVGGRYTHAETLTRALAPWVLLAGLAPVASNTLDYLGRARQRLPFAVGAVAVNALIDVALLQRIGVVAAAIGTDVGMAVFTCGTLWLCGRAVGYRAAYLLADLRRAVAAGALATAIMLPVGLATDELAPLAGSLVAAAAAFALIVVRPERGLRLRSPR
jgi:O-antigen/teichoic acid export membrane protein